MKDHESVDLPVLSGFVRHGRHEAEPLTAPLRTDALGTAFRYYARAGDQIVTSTSVRVLAQRLGRVTLNPRALAEALAFGFVLRDETVLNEVRSIPPHTTLNIDGTLTRHAAPRRRPIVTDAAAAVQELQGRLTDVIRELEPAWDRHLVGFTGGKDSRILAAMPKSTPDRWHWLTVSGRDDAEHRGSTETAARLGLRHFAWSEWTSGFLDGDVHRVSADLANGVGAVSDQTLLRSYFERYRTTALDRSFEADHSHPEFEVRSLKFKVSREVPLWIGTLADGLFAGTYLSPPAGTIWDAVTPRTSHLSRALAPSLLEAFDEQRGYYASNPFTPASTSPEDAGYFIRLLTRGRSFVCRSLGCFDRAFPVQVNPYLHPEMLALAFDIDAALLGSDSLRDGLLRNLGTGLDGPSAFGYRAPAYAHHVFRMLTQEVAASRVLDGLLADPLLEEMRAGRFPDLNPNPTDANSTTPAYRVHSAEPQPVIRSLRDYEHLLVYITFLNLLMDDGVTLSI